MGADVVVVDVVCSGTLKTAVTAFASSMLTLQAPFPLQSPSQPAKVDPGAGVAVSVAVEPFASVTEHVPGQVIPLPETDPLPEPPRPTFSAKGPGLSKVALTPTLANSPAVKVQVPVPEQAPPQPTNVAPASGEAFSVPVEPVTNDALHLVGQSIVEALTSDGDPEPVTWPGPLTVTFTL